MTYFLALMTLLTHTLLATEWEGADYSQNSSVQLSHAERLLKNLSLKGDETLLDVGCGDGKITALLAKKVPDGIVIGIDPSKSMIKQANTMLAQSALTNLVFCEESAECFSFYGRFDHIFAIHVMHWVKDQEIALKNIHFHLKPFGKAHFIIAPSKEGLPFHTALQKTLKTFGQDFYGFVNSQQVFDMETYRKLMVKAGFHVDAIHYFYHESVHENKEKLKSWIHQWSPHVKHLPKATQEQFLDELMNNYLIAIGLAPNHMGQVIWGEYVMTLEGTKRAI